ncbi:MAG: addiction module protein [Bryobacteraceae bacterium]|nr:addiction module protein [Bryobacteraceae bacterium]
MKYPTREELLELSLEDRYQLLDDLWVTLIDSTNELPEWQRRVLNERLDRMESHPGRTYSWEEVRQEIESRHALRAPLRT